MSEGSSLNTKGLELKLNFWSWPVNFTLFSLPTPQTTEPQKTLPQNLREEALGLYFASNCLHLPNITQHFFSAELR